MRSEVDVMGGEWWMVMVGLVVPWENLLLTCFFLNLSISLSHSHREIERGRKWLKMREKWGKVESECKIMWNSSCSCWSWDDTPERNQIAAPIFNLRSFFLFWVALYSQHHVLSLTSLESVASDFRIQFFRGICFICCFIIIIGLFG